MLSPSVPALFLFGASGAVPVFGFGRWWTVLSATWLHGGLLHILFNMMWVRRARARNRGRHRPGAHGHHLRRRPASAGFLLSSVGSVPVRHLPIPMLRGAGFTVGASASIFGLLGALVHYGRRSGSSLIRRQAMQLRGASLFVFGLIMPGVDNYAHAGGFVGGYAMSAFLNPMTRERGDHILVAIGCLAATFGAIVFSVVRGLRLFL